MIETIDQACVRLRLLDDIDQELDRLAAEAAAAPKNLAAERSVLAELTTAREATEQALAGARKRMAEAEREHEALEAKRDRANKRMETIASQAQLDATTRELETLAELIGESETVILMGYDEVETLEATLDEQTERQGNATVGLAEHEAAWIAREPIVVARQAELTAAREPQYGALDSRVAQRYMLGRQQAMFTPLSGITWIHAGTICTTCNARISPRWVQDSGDYKAWHACDSCKRLMVKTIVQDGPEGDDEAAEAAEG